MGASVKDLAKQIRYHKNLYYQGIPEISDSEFDALEDQLRKIDPDHPVLNLVGMDQMSGPKVRHDTKMLSLNKTYRVDELIKWIEGREVVSMMKIDGVSCSLVYENGILQLAKTRGDGQFGEDITAKVLWMNSVPQTIDLKDRIEVRGEMYCREEGFFHLSDKMESLNLDRPTSQRNIVAGLMGRKDHISLCQYLEFMAFDLLSDTLKFETERQKIALLGNLGFESVELTFHKTEKTIQRSIDEIEQFMSEGDILVDGLVWSFDQLSWHEELGATAHHPRAKMAFKFQGESKTTKIEELLWSVSRNGILTPIAIVEPVELSGAKISRVTLHNYGMVRQFQLKSGDLIEIVRSGEVIPKFLNVIKSSDVSKYTIPKHCPECETSIVIDDIRLRCTNESCPAVVKESILNFIQKIGIEDISSKRLQEMIRVGLVKEISDLYELKQEDFLQLDKTKEKLAQKMYENIQTSKDVDLTTFLSALGLTGGAYNKCEKIVQAGFNTLKKVQVLDVKNLNTVESFSDRSSELFLKSLRSKEKLINQLRKVGFDSLDEEPQTGPQRLEGKKFCITGTLSSKRSIVEKFIRDNGGIVSSSVSKTTDYLVTNDKESSSSKFVKAKKFDIPIIPEEELKNLIGES